MQDTFDFNDLFIFEMANNHQGSVDHGLKIIKEVGAVAKEAGVKGAIKFQFRDLDTHIHPHYKERTDLKYPRRFIETRLDESQFRQLVAATAEEGLVPMSTPFDEPSVDFLLKLDLPVIKVGSPSASDWSLLHKVAHAGKPVICSTGGLSLKEIDNLVSLFHHKGVRFALMHCVSIYPTPIEKLQLNQIGVMRQRYPDVAVGFSTHEDPDNTDAIKIAYAKGARLFERHVDVEEEGFKPNAYSSTPEQLKKWLAAYKEAVAACGAGSRPPVDHTEVSNLSPFMRGVFAKTDLKQGDAIRLDDVYFAIPLHEGQLKSGEWRDELTADKDYTAHEPLADDLGKRKPTTKELIYSSVHDIKGMLNEARIPVGHDFTVELSHHYGLERFREVGAAIIDCINREYCKKLIVQLPGQEHPYHFHKKKEETFQVLYGEMEVEIEGNKKLLYPGDTLTVQRGVWHRFKTDKGVIFEEVSTTHFNDDSFYEDKGINQMAREERKTQLVNWGRFQFD